MYKGTGPERLSGAERAALIAEITGRPLAFLAITEKQLRAGLTQAGLPGEVVNTLISIQASFAAGAVPHVTRDAASPGGPPPPPPPRALFSGPQIPFAPWPFTPTTHLPAPR